MTDEPTAPETIQNPTTAEDFTRRGWTLHVQGEQDRAEKDFRRAVELDSQSVEAHYGLGMALRARRKGDEAIRVFEKTIELIDAGELEEDSARATMLRRLSRSHITMIQKGNFGTQSDKAVE